MIVYATSIYNEYNNISHSRFLKLHRQFMKWPVIIIIIIFFLFFYVCWWHQILNEDIIGKLLLRAYPKVTVDSSR